uniref:CAZy families GH23 protein n=1 Tax=uncultured Lactobacillus sp. TaxID=153152 RepID=A0A060CH33_9LACO|nr:CAZy families GH23 protein [uncultured Lactobacillus sp.]
MHKRFVDLVRGIISPFNSMLDGLRKGINWILEKVGASGISGSWSIPMPSYANGTKDTHPGGLAIVNDGQTGHYREMYRLPNGQIGMFPATRNMIVPLPKGTSVLDGDSSYRLARILGQTPHYAGGIGSFFSGLLEKARIFSKTWIRILAHPIQFAEDVFKNSLM